jgi:rare lipoprotein A
MIFEFGVRRRDAALESADASAHSTRAAPALRTHAGATGGSMGTGLGFGVRRHAAALESGDASAHSGWRPIPIAVALCAGLLLAACARPPMAPRAIVPGMSETGLASWYGPGFHGRRTSSGEVFDMHQLTAAHRELPLGTWIVVTNLDNGRAVEVRVNDRGPFVPERILDLSYAAAGVLGVLGPGVVPVRLVVSRLGADAASASPVRFTVQVGSFVSEDNARRLHQALAASQPEVEVTRRTIGAGEYYRVRVGNFPTREEARLTAEALARQGHQAIIMERDC